MILAAGRGNKMRPLTDRTPKPLLEAGGKALIVWHLEKLARAGFRQIVINHSHLGHLIEAALGDGRRYGVEISYSPESEALETAGGMAHALPLLGDPPFLAVNADIFSDFDYSGLVPKLREMESNRNGIMAYLVLVDNPEHHPDGDFSLSAGKVAVSGAPMLTFGGIGLYRPELFRGVAPGAKAKLAPLLREMMGKDRVAGEHYRGRWVDVGTPQRLRELNTRLAVK